MIAKLKARIDKLNEVGENEFNGTDYSFGFKTWQGGTLTILRQLFPENKELIKQIERIEVRRVNVHRTDSSAYNLVACKNEAKEVLEMLIDTKVEPIEVPIKQDFDFWNLLHPRVKELAKTRFENGLYADCVSVCLKEINMIVKEHVRNAINQELDGAPLMTRAFSANNPIIQFGDLTTENGRNIQLGYMKIFEGAMIGIRNPKAHVNMYPDGNKAIHFLFLSSFMFIKLQETGVI
jgi:uncharacterized protein (TIGR02391 family)